MSKIIAVTNQKGGVGKTTTAVNVAYFLARRKYKVLLVDFDPQGNATSSVGLDKESLKLTVVDALDESTDLAEIIQKTRFYELDIVPSTPALADAEPGLAKVDIGQRFVRLRHALADVAGDYDFVIIDSPPSLSLLTINALVAAKYVILPVQAEFFAMEGLTQLLNTIKLIRQNGLNPTLDILGVLPTMVGKNTLAKQVVEQIAKYFPGKIFNASVPRNVRVAEAPSFGLPVGAYDKRSKGGRAYDAVTKEIIERTR
ncbi:MAG: AAA family ATPase [Candidatus Nomurabacteria bacterium]|nr:AAA family ATPase [Candidatus Nomurabacteria bacterium]